MVGVNQLLQFLAVVFVGSNTLRAFRRRDSVDGKRTSLESYYHTQYGWRQKSEYLLCCTLIHITFRYCQRLRVVGFQALVGPGGLAKKDGEPPRKVSIIFISSLRR